MTITATPSSPSQPRLPGITTHAAVRMQQRGIRPAAVQAALTYGRRIHAKGVTFCVLGRKEVQRGAEHGLDLQDLEGLQVLVSHDGAVVTAYRNRDLHAIKATPRRPVRRGNLGRH